MLNTLRERLTQILSHIELQTTTNEESLVFQRNNPKMIETRDDPAFQREVPNPETIPMATPIRSRQASSEINPEDSLRKYLERITLFTENDNDADSKANQVSIMTLHSAKGLEFPFVFMIGMSEGLFPNQRSLDEGRVDEERRLCYVGITRAQQELTFSMAKYRKRFGEIIRQEPSRFLLNINPELLTVPIIGEASEEVKKERRHESRSAFFTQFKQIEAS